MTMASLTASLLARKGHAQPSASARDIFAPDSSDKRWRSPVKTKAVANEDPKGAPEKERSSAPRAADPVPPRPRFVPNEARHTRLVQTDEVGPRDKNLTEAISEAKSATAAVRTTSRQSKTDLRKHKTLRLDIDTDTRLRLLAARKGTSQQALMEEAVKALLKAQTVDGKCICGSSKG